MKTAVVVALATIIALASADDCKITGDWFSSSGGPVGSNVLSAVETGTNTFNLTLDIRHGAGVLPGIYTGPNAFMVKYNSQAYYGSIDPGCNGITWNSTEWGSQWCRAWTPNCTVATPPFGKVFSIWSVFGDNMVLQRAPQQAAVYGIAPNVSSPNVTVTVTGEGKSYTMQAEMNTVQQPFGDGFVYPWPYPGPFPTWKVVLPATEAGGNYTITANCHNCEIWDPEYQSSNITGVTFGDMWYCSGQSNMWLPVLHTFERNKTLAAIQGGKYSNIRLQAGNSGEQGYADFHPWVTAQQSITQPGSDGPILFDFGAACWYFAQVLTDMMEASGTAVPIGLQDTAVGGQRIEEYMDNTTISTCSDRAGESLPQWDGPLFGKFVMPYVDMTVKGWLWYQGENNMGNTKGSSMADVGYGCEMKVLVEGWRKRWSKVPGTTPADAPFGVVTLASSGSEGGPDMGAMRWAQTANYGVLPNAAIPNSFLAQAYDLDDPWGPEGGPCFKDWQCCGKKVNMTMCNAGTNNNPSMCEKACEADSGTATVMGGIHPRDKYPVGTRLAKAAFNTVYGGKDAFTGPTLAGCSVEDGQLEVRFNTTLLRGDEVIIQTYNQTLNMSYLEVMTDPTLFCVETQKVNSSCREHCAYTCPSWAGGSSITNDSALTGSTDMGWYNVNISLASTSSITADLSPLFGAAPTAVRYGWGTSECCNKADPLLYVDYPCGPAPCPLMGKSGFPANPFIAKIVDGKCECVAPQVCDG